ncbi:hypothetical protein VTO42DRAFT_7314 [Malbranchea cinnamomea]
MGKIGFFSLALLSLQALLVRGQEAAEDVGEDAQQPFEIPKLAVSASASFPASEIFGVKVINGNPTEALVTFTNNEEEAVRVNFIGGSFWTLDSPGKPSTNIRNLTATRYNVEVAPNSQHSLPYDFTTDMHPQDLRLSLAAIVTDGKGNIFTIPAYNQTVSVVEPDTSIFDPQIIFLYVFLLTCFAGVVYLFYNVWIAPYFPQKRKRGRSGERRQKSSEQPQSPGSDDGTTAKTYDAEWIPAHHIQPPQPRKVKGGRSRK